jgi:hypothetical protein
MHTFEDFSNNLRESGAQFLPYLRHPRSPQAIDSNLVPEKLRQADVQNVRDLAGSVHGNIAAECAAVEDVSQFGSESIVSCSRATYSDLPNVLQMRAANGRE